MSEEKIIVPCENCLTAMPGDKIEFVAGTDTILCETVKSAGWVPTPKNGKVWSYETEEGTTVASDKVTRVIKAEVKNIPPATVEEVLTLGQLNDFVAISDSIEKSTSLSSKQKVILHAVIRGDKKNLELASWLIDFRIQEINDFLENANPISI